MAVGMMRTMEEAMRADRRMRDNGDDDGVDFLPDLHPCGVVTKCARAVAAS